MTNQNKIKIRWTQAEWLTLLRETIRLFPRFPETKVISIEGLAKAQQILPEDRRRNTALFKEIGSRLADHIVFLETRDDVLVIAQAENTVVTPRLVKAPAPAAKKETQQSLPLAPTVNPFEAAFAPLVAAVAEQVGGLITPLIKSAITNAVNEVVNVHMEIVSDELRDTRIAIGLQNEELRKQQELIKTVIRNLEEVKNARRVLSLSEVYVPPQQPGNVAAPRLIAPEDDDWEDATLQKVEDNIVPESAPAKPEVKSEPKPVVVPVPATPVKEIKKSVVKVTSFTELKSAVKQKEQAEAHPDEEPGDNIGNRRPKVALLGLVQPEFQRARDLFPQIELHSVNLYVSDFDKRIVDYDFVLSLKRNVPTAIGKRLVKGMDDRYLPIEGKNFGELLRTITKLINEGKLPQDLA